MKERREDCLAIGGEINLSVACRMYAFDIHCNSYFPLFILLYGKLVTLTSGTCGSQTALLSQAKKKPTPSRLRPCHNSRDMSGRQMCLHWSMYGLAESLVMPVAVLQFVLSPVLLWRSFVSTILANLLYMVALSYYHYLSFLGYSALPFLEHTEVFLWPVAAIVIVVPFAVLAGFNPSRFTLNIYFG